MVANRKRASLIWTGFRAPVSLELVSGPTLNAYAKTPRNSAGPLVVVHARDAEAVVTRLAERDIVVSSRRDGVRTSFHVYNTLEDVRAVLEVLEENQELKVP